MGEWLSRRSAQDSPKYSLYPTRTRNGNTWLLHMHVPLLHLIKHDCDKTWEKYLATTGRSETLYLGMYFNFGVRSPDYVIEASNINRLHKVFFHKNGATPFPVWGCIPKWHSDYTDHNREQERFTMRPSTLSIVWQTFLSERGVVRRNPLIHNEQVIKVGGAERRGGELTRWR